MNASPFADTVTAAATPPSTNTALATRESHRAGNRVTSTAAAGHRAEQRDAQQDPAHEAVGPQVRDREQEPADNPHGECGEHPDRPQGAWDRGAGDVAGGGRVVGHGAMVRDGVASLSSVRSDAG